MRPTARASWRSSAESFFGLLYVWCVCPGAEGVQWVVVAAVVFCVCGCGQLKQPGSFCSSGRAKMGTGCTRTCVRGVW